MCLEVHAAALPQVMTATWFFSRIVEHIFELHKAQHTSKQCTHSPSTHDGIIVWGSQFRWWWQRWRRFWGWWRK